MGRRRYDSRKRYRRSSYTLSQRGWVEDLLELIAHCIKWIWRRATTPRGAKHGTFDPFAIPPPLPLTGSRSADTTSAAPPAENGLENLPYRRTRGVLSKGEYAVWVPLYHAVRGKYRIFCKVRLADIVCCPRGRADERRWFRKIGRYHVDFVICHPQTTEPLLVIELDDRRHRERVRKARDDFKDAVLRAASVPVYRIPAQQAYDVIELEETITRLIAL
jgi:hypothetical protein